LLVSHKYRFIFMRTEKTASTSLSKALYKLHEGAPAMSDGRPACEGVKKRPGWAKVSPIHYGALERNLPELFGLHAHATARQIRSVLGPEVFDSYYKFAVDRNPWDRQVSLYKHRQHKHGKRVDFDRDMRSWFYRATEYSRLHNWDIYAIDGAIVANKVLRYESLEQDLAELAQRLEFDKPLDLPRLREYSADRAHYATYYSDVTRQLVADWYAPEIAALGYRFETAPEKAAEAAGAPA
jgi:hypothetical protein